MVRALRYALGICGAVVGTAGTHSPALRRTPSHVQTASPPLTPGHHRPGSRSLASSLPRISPSCIGGGAGPGHPTRSPSMAVRLSQRVSRQVDPTVSGVSLGDHGLCAALQRRNPPQRRVAAYSWTRSGKKEAAWASRSKETSFAPTSSPAFGGDAHSGDPSPGSVGSCSSIRGPKRRDAAPPGSRDPT